MTTKTMKTSKEKKAGATLDAVKHLDPSKIIQELGALQVNIQGTLATVGSSINEKIAKMDQLDEAIQLKEERLAELFELDKEALALEQLRLIRTQEAAEQETKRKETLKAWADEDKARVQKLQREQEEYNYKTTQERQRLLDALNSEVEKHKREEKIRVEELNRDWQARENELVARENELAVLRNKVASFDETLKAEVAKAEAILGNKMKRDFELQTKLAEKDIESEKKLHAAEVAALNARILGLTNQLADIQNQLEAARMDVKETTQRALDSASGRLVSEALQKVVDTNGSNKKN